MLLPEGWRRWEVLRIARVQLVSPATEAWQLLNRLGKPAGVGLFADRQAAIEWATKRCDRLEGDQLEGADSSEEKELARQALKPERATRGQR